MSNPITITKIVPPTRRPDLVKRPRLLNLFDTLLEHKLFLISAQAGYGKTSLLVDMIDQSEIPICWLSLDALDRDPHRFLPHFIEAIAYRFPKYGEQSRSALKIANSELDIQSVITIIINELYETIDEHFIFVLDDYHFVDSVDVIEQFINQFIQNSHENFHMIIASRNIINIPDITLLVARGQVDGFDFSDLAFQVEEVQLLLQQNHQIHLDSATAKELVNETEGWITGLLLSTKTVWQSLIDKTNRIARTSGVDIYQFLARQVLDQQSPIIREFLLNTSLLEEFNADLCANIFGAPPENNTWSEMINDILQKNLFVIPIQGDKLWLRYHQLFRDFLQSQITIEDPEKKNDILISLAKEYTDRQEWEKAYALHQKVGTQESVADFIELVDQSLWDAGRIGLAEHWLNSFSLDTLKSRPILLARKASIFCAKGDFKNGFDLFAQAEIIFTKQDNPFEISRLNANRASWLYVQGNYMAALEDAEKVVGIAGKKKKFRRLWAEAMKAKGASLASLGHINDGVKYLQKALEENERLSLSNNAASCCIDLGKFMYINGDYEDAIAIYNKGIAYYKGDNNAANLASQLNNLGVLYHSLGKLEEAKTTLEKALQLAQNIGRPRLEAFIFVSIGDLYLDLDAIDAARTAYDHANKPKKNFSNDFLELYLSLSQVKTHRLKNETEKATLLLESISSKVHKSSQLVIKGINHMEMGLLDLQNTTPKNAILSFEQSLHCFLEGGNKAEAAQVTLYLANTWYSLDEYDKAIDSLENAFEITNKLNNFYPLIPVAKKMMDLLTSAFRSQKTNKNASHLIEKIEEFNSKLPNLRQAIRKSSSLVPFAPPILTVQSLGRNQVLRDGKTIQATEWKNRRNVRDLFFLLLAHPNGLTKEEIGLFFWPEVTSAKLKMNFKNAVYRLRRALGQNQILYDGNVYSFNFGTDYNWDLEEFHHHIENAKIASGTENKITAYKAAIEIYRGDYLPSIDQNWIEPIREETFLYYKRAIFALGKLLLAANKPDEALIYSWRILSIDPLLEDANNLIMEAHAMLGNRHEVSKQFNTFKERLQNEMGILPSKETTALYESLIK